MLTAFPLSEIERIVKRTAIGALITGIGACAVAVLVGYAYFAPGMILGLALAIANHRFFQSSALRFTTPDGVVNRKPFAGSVALRLGACTAVAFGLLAWKQPVGWGVVGGLVLFQAVMLANATFALLAHTRRGADHGGGGDA